MTLSVNAANALRGLGRNQKKALQFFCKYPGWHSINTDATTIRTIDSLVYRKLLVRNEHMQACFVGDIKKGVTA